METYREDTRIIKSLTKPATIQTKTIKVSTLAVTRVEMRFFYHKTCVNFKHNEIAFEL